PIAGDDGLAGRLLAALEPFVWRRSVDASTIEEMRALKARITSRAQARGDDVKLGPGGIREIEFFIQTLQLLHGGRDRRLRERSTLGALANALVAGLLSARDHDALCEAWLLLRRVEHRLQMVHERRTHALPSSPEALRSLALGLGFATAETFAAALGRHRSFVGELFSDLLHTSGVEPAPLDAELSAAADPDGADETRLRALATRGFVDAPAALACLRRMGQHPESPFARRGGVPRGGVELLAGCAGSPDPNLALLHLGELFSSLRAPGAWYDLLARRPATAQLLTTLFGTSDYLSRLFLRHPELADSLVRAEAAVTLKGHAWLAEELSVRLMAEAAPEPQAEQILAILRRFKNEEVLRIGLHDVAGNLEVEQVHEELSALADVLVGACLDLCRKEVLTRWGEPCGPDGAPASLAVIGLGSLGGRELGYHSDLDLLFVYSAPGDTRGGEKGRASNAEYFARLAQKLLSSLSMQLREGLLYRTDVRLRPSGNAGMLVVSLESFAAHHQKAEVWERQALTRARLVAGDAALFGRVREEVIAPLVFRPEADPRGLAREILRVRERMEHELAGEGPLRLSPKLGRGGLVDIEFAVQYLQLAHGRARPGVRETNTLKAIRALASEGALAPADASALERGWRFLRRLEDRLRIVHVFPLTHLPTRGPGLTTLARRMGYSGTEGGAKLLADYEAITAEVRARRDGLMRT
ncbi:MAG: bifunctional [glutamate--ammonia ligase]-adenylyl-L-tyrosine phosphorylase/[glutamate--ammonia-ligase] adenylyltransferase, partial [Deltaproteobacteria bacterium]|nr:bifunctional [glutamate--ammonia ligase]-adenylyl-L-tyrosine phosphorylase/[glutamate--ammonia-ligase] adenylyltransferase [Deltaproteobacteria bacterium]